MKTKASSLSRPITRSRMRAHVRTISNASSFTGGCDTTMTISSDDLVGPATASRAGGCKPLRFHWSLSQAGNPFRRATQTDQMPGIPSFEAQLELCRFADEYGIDSVLMAIGFARPDPIVLSAALGRKTQRVKFMVACRPGLISPTSFVQQINTLSLLIDGRVHVNIVGGHTPRELQSYGDWLPREQR